MRAWPSPTPTAMAVSGSTFRTRCTTTPTSTRSSSASGRLPEGLPVPRPRGHARLRASRHQDSDYQRERRQQFVLQSIRKQLDPMALLPHIPGLLEVAQQNLFMTFSDDFPYLAQVASRVDADRLYQYDFAPPHLAAGQHGGHRAKVQNIFSEPEPEPEPQQQNDGARPRTRGGDLQDLSRPRSRRSDSRSPSAVTAVGAGVESAPARPPTHRPRRRLPSGRRLRRACPRSSRPRTSTGWQGLELCPRRAAAGRAPAWRARRGCRRR